MTLEEAKKYLSGFKRWELRDHAFGDMEFGWTDKDHHEIAGGYAGSSGINLTIAPGGIIDGEWVSHTVAAFSGVEATELLKCGLSVQIERNDETGPDTFEQGKIMPGLTKEGVLAELTNHSNVEFRDALEPEDDLAYPCGACDCNPCCCMVLKTSPQSVKFKS